MDLAGQILLSFILSFFIITALAGNLLVIVAILTDRNLRKAGNIFLVSLALADTFVACFVMSFAMVNDVAERWLLGKEFCKIWISADVMCSSASILNLCAISLDRYLHIRSPLHYDNMVSHKRVLFVVAVIWTMSALISFLPIQLDWHQLEIRPSVSKFNLTNSTFNSTLYKILTSTQANNTTTKISISDEDMCQLELSPLYAVTSSTISFYLPCLAMTLIYYRLLQYAKKHVSHIKMTTTPHISKQPNKSLHTLKTSSSPSQVLKVTSTDKTSDHKAFMTLGIIMGVFLVCWAPFFTVNVVDSFCRCVHPVVWASFTWLGYVNSSMNPVIYGIFNRQFRDAFQKVIYSFLWKCCGVKDRYFDYNQPYQTPLIRSFQGNEDVRNSLKMVKSISGFPGMVGNSMMFQEKECTDLKAIPCARSNSIKTTNQFELTSFKTTISSNKLENTKSEVIKSSNITIIVDKFRMVDEDEDNDVRIMGGDEDGHEMKK